jgi:hybrid polyketide synthase / nonribosomal peptide synthetase ACE1
MSSYTYTDISVGFFDKAAELFKAYREKMVYKPFDVEKAPTSQGFEQNAYDIVIASNVLHATASIQKTLEHARQLLKPGGYLLMLELTNNGPIRRTNIMGGLPGWWIGEEDGRKGAPTITPNEWHAALRRSGFSGVDALTPDVDVLPWPFSIMASQAVDDHVNFLRRPLIASPSSVSLHLPQVVILGTQSLETTRIAEELSDLLSRFCDQVTIINDLPTEHDAQSLSLSPTKTTFINLVDLDSPILKGLNGQKMAGLKRVFELGKHILWVTSGAQADEPYHMASVAFSRVISHEARHISLNHLDVSDLGHNVARNIAEHLLRQYALEEWDKDNQQLLWSKEPEVYLNRGQLRIPRVKPNVDMNQRLSASKRVIKKSVSLARSTISIIASPPTSFKVVEEVFPIISRDETTPLVKTECSTSMAIGLGADVYLFLGIGKPLNDVKATDFFITLSETNSSQTRPFVSAAVDDGLIKQVGSNGLLIAVASECIAALVMRALPTGSSIIIHCLDQHRFLAAALARRTSAESVRITFVCSSECSDTQGLSWVRLDPRAPMHVMRKTLLRSQPTHYLDLTSGSDLDTIFSQVRSPRCKQLDSLDLLRSCSSVPTLTNRDLLMAQIREAVAHAHKALTTQATRDYSDVLVKLDDVDGNAVSSSIMVISWPQDGFAKVQVQPLETRRLFSQDKTYLLVGLSGQIGQSLCNWMIQNGAGCVVLTSRRPNVDERWLQSVGGRVEVMALDVMDYTSLDKVVKDIRTTCPPIAGVANGAMVLHDSLFSEMTLEQMTEVLGPKIDGTRNLDRLFYNDDLDFFVLFSSSAGVIGNSGQSNYAAANGYLNALARQRRKRGLAASAFDIGRVAGIGYAEAAGQVVIEQLTRFGLLPISEPDFHTMFAETIRAGYVDPGQHLEECEDERAVVTTGIRQVRDDEEIQGPWFSNPRFAHCIIEARSAEADTQTQDKRTSLPVSKQLSNAANMEEALETLKECFTAKLHVILQSTDCEIDPDTPLVELGVDSLVAVEVRSWFLKELKVDVPVLKVVGGSSVADLCQLALGKLPEELVASIGTGGDAAEGQASEKKPTKAASPSSKVPVQTEMQSYSAEDAMSVSSSAQSFTQGQDTPPTQPSLTSKSSSADLADAANPDISSRIVKREQISFGQSRFWFLRHLLQDQTTFNVAFYYKITGGMRVGDLDRAVRMVAARHEALRTCFVANNDQSEADMAFQEVLESSPMRLEHSKITSAEEVASWYADLKAHVFDIANGEVMRLILLTLSPTSHYMLINYHHIMMDGVSLQVFMADLEKAYKGVPLSLAAPPRQFVDFSRAQRAAYEKGAMSEELKFWQGVFPDEPPVLPLLPMAQVSSRRPMQSFEVHQVEFRIDPALARRVKATARTQRCTPFHFYLAAFKLMLFLFTDVEELTIGIADANRNDSDVINTIGMLLLNLS